MATLLLALGSGVAFLIAYHTYGRWLGQRIFRLSADTLCPSHALRDNTDYVPTHRAVVFGHHFTSIAGTGPIVGPAIAIMWGWLPALLWVLVGSIFIGAVHDLGALVVSLRNRGLSVGDIAGRLLNPRVRLLFLFLLFLALTLVLAIFGLVIASVFKQYPAAIFPCVLQVPLALAIGTWLHRRGIGLFLPSILALALMYVSVIYGDVGPLHSFNQSLATWSSWTWVLALLAYAYAASILPVWSLLQPRDYINSLQLLSALGLIVAGLAAAAFLGGPPLANGSRPPLELVAPMVQWSPQGAPLLFPFLFITIACGAISGFHCLVSSGTSSKQLDREPDARFVAYGGMLTEGFLAVLVILACAAGLGLGLQTADGSFLTGEAAWLSRYAAWSSKLGPLVAAFVEGSANFLRTLGIPQVTAIALMGVLVASFASTTLDTACRLQRYIIQELSRALGESLPVLHRPLQPFQHRHGATLLAVALAALLAALPPPGQPWSLAQAGQGGLILWPLFGATNQLLGGLSFLVIAFHLWRRQQPIAFLVLPMVFMLIMPLWAMLSQSFIGSPGNPSWISDGKWALVSFALATVALEIWMIIEAALLFPRTRGLLEPGAPPPPSSSSSSHASLPS
jgi:carbon starvation protein